MKQIKINGLLWDAENLEIDGQTHFTFNDAQEVAKSVGKRLPTKKEYEELASMRTRWDTARKGRLFRANKDNELFLPASGYLHFAWNTPLYVGSDGLYWSDTPFSKTDAYCLYFGSGVIGPQGHNNRAHGFAVRCVQDIE